MPSARGALAVSAFALSMVIAASPARSATTTIVGTVVKQTPPISIDTCTAELDGEVFTPSVTLHADARIVVAQTFELTFLDAKKHVTGHASVTPPFVAAIADGGAFSAMRCEVSDMKLDDGSTYSNAGAERDPHGFVNAFIGVGILAAIGFLASRNNSGHSDNGASATDTPLPTDTPTIAPSSSASGAATATPTASGSASGAATPIRLIVTAAPTLTPAPATTPAAHAAIRQVAPHRS